MLLRSVLPGRRRRSSVPHGERSAGNGRASYRSSPANPRQRHSADATRPALVVPWSSALDPRHRRRGPWVPILLPTRVGAATPPPAARRRRRGLEASVAPAASQASPGTRLLPPSPPPGAGARSRTALAPAVPPLPPPRAAPPPCPPLPPPRLMGPPG